METIVQWATVLSPIVAIGIAFWVNYSGRKDTKKQVDAIKRLSVVQAEITIIQNEIELYKNHLKLQQAKELEFDDNSIEAYQVEAWKIGERHRKNRQSQLDKEYYLKLQVELQQKQKELIELKNELKRL